MTASLFRLPSILVVVLVCYCCCSFTVASKERRLSPFFNPQEDGLSPVIDEASMDAEGNVVNNNGMHKISHEIKHKREAALRRQLAVGNQPNLPGGGAYIDNGLAGGSGSGNGNGGTGSGSGGGKGMLGKGGKGGKGKFGKSGKGKGSSSGSSSSKGKGSSSSSSSSSSKGKGKGNSGSNSNGNGDNGGGKEPSMPEWDDEWTDGIVPCLCTPTFCDCEDGQLATDYEFVLVRDEIGSDTPGDAEFGVASGIGLNGHVHEMVYTTTGRDFGSDPIGIFKGFCTVVSDLSGELLCTYEIYITANGDTGVGGVIVTGPVAGLETGQEFESVVTGAEFDFAPFNTGFLTTVQDPAKPILYSFLSLYL